MRLDRATWQEVDKYLAQNGGIILPVGSTEQHGPIGMIGTDALCADAIAERAAAVAETYVAPVLAYTPAPFNTAFPGTLSVSEKTFEALFGEVISGLTDQGFTHIYVLNAHGANLAPMRRVVHGNPMIRIRSWWDFDAVNVLRSELFGDWEGLHATPSEISITRYLFGSTRSGTAPDPPRQLSKPEIARRAGDNHGAPDLHRREFPDGRVGAHSALANAEFGARLLDAAVQGVADDFRSFTKSKHV